MNEEQEEQQSYPLMQQPMGIPSQMTEGLLEYQLEVQDIIDKLVHTFNSESMVLNKKTGIIEWKRKESIPPMINEMGAISIISELEPRLTKIFVLSDLDEEIINNMVYDLARTIKDDFRDNWDTYKIRGTAAASKILHLLCDTYYATLRKAHLGGYLKFLKTTTQEIQHHQSIQSGRQPQQQMQPLRSKIPVIGRLLK